MALETLIWKGTKKPHGSLEALCLGHRAHVRHPNQFVSIFFSLPFFFEHRLADTSLSATAAYSFEYFEKAFRLCKEGLVSTRYLRRYKNKHCKRNSSDVRIHVRRYMEGQLLSV